MSVTAARGRHDPPRAGVSPSDRTATRGARSLLLSCALVTVVVFAYHNGVSAPFIFDDDSIVEDFAQRGLSAADVVIVGSTRPLVQLSFAANYAAGELDVRGYHLINTTIHALAAVALFAIALRTLDRPWLAFTIALLWAVHPLQTESVTYVSQRAESLAGLFALTTLYCVIRGATSARGTPWYAATVLACLLGMGSKPVMVVIPVVVLLYDRTFLAGSWRLAWRRRRVLYAGLAATWVALIVLLAQPHESASTAGFSMSDLTSRAYARSEPEVILYYLRLAFWPMPLVLDYGWPVAENPVAILLSSLAIVGLLAVAVWTFQRRPHVGFLGIAFFILLAPSSGFIPIRDLAAEHRMYLPLAPLTALVVLAAAHLLRVIPGTTARRTLSTVLVCASVAGLILLTVRRNAEYGAPIEIWRDISLRRPMNARAHNNLARLLIETGRIAEASPHAVRAVELGPSYAHARNNLGVVLRTQGRPEEAIRQLDEALRLDPGYADAYNNRGLAWVDRRRFGDAVADYEHALRLRPRSAEIHGNLGNAMLVQGKIAEAISEYKIALGLQPNRAELHYNMALALSARKDRESARIHYAEALRLNPALAAAIGAREAGATEPQTAPGRP